jgi:hypothetical protein
VRIRCSVQITRTPLLLESAGDGVRASSRSSAVYFDATDMDGEAGDEGLSLGCMSVDVERAGD